MSRYDSFHNFIDDAPETYYQGAVFVNRAYYHMLHTNGYEHNYTTRAILHEAHNRINEELKNRSEYVSTYLGD
jgi:hypothetical protein